MLKVVTSFDHYSLQIDFICNLSCVHRLIWWNKLPNIHKVIRINPKTCVLSTHLFLCQLQLLEQGLAEDVVEGAVLGPVFVCVGSADTDAEVLVSVVVTEST